MKHYNVVCAVIVNEKGEIFCTRRGPGRALEGFWEFPGGKVENRETKEETIVREIKEELNSLVKPLSFLCETTYTYENLGEYPSFSITLYAYYCKLINGNLELTEHSEAKWVKKEDLVKLNFAPADRPIIELITNSEN